MADGGALRTFLGEKSSPCPQSIRAAGRGAGITLQNEHRAEGKEVGGTWGGEGGHRSEVLVTREAHRAQGNMLLTRLLIDYKTTELRKGWMKRCTGHGMGKGCYTSTPPRVPSLSLDLPKCTILESMGACPFGF